MAKYENQGAPFWTPGRNVTGHADVALTGKRFVAIAGPRTDGNPTVGLPAAGGRVFGVTAYDTPADDKVTLYRGGIVPVEADGPIAAGAPLFAAADGRATATDPGAGSNVVGIAVDDAADGEDAVVDLDRA